MLNLKLGFWIVATIVFCILPWWCYISKSATTISQNYSNNKLYPCTVVNGSGASAVIIDLWQSTHHRLYLKSSWAPVWLSPVASCCPRQMRWTCPRCCTTALLQCFLQNATKKVTHNTKKKIHNEWSTVPLWPECQTRMPPIDLCDWFAGSPRWIIPTEVQSRRQARLSVSPKARASEQAALVWPPCLGTRACVWSWVCLSRWLDDPCAGWCL